MYQYSKTIVNSSLFWKRESEEVAISNFWPFFRAIALIPGEIKLQTI